MRKHACGTTNDNLDFASQHGQEEQDQQEARMADLDAEFALFEQEIGGLEGEGEGEGEGGSSSSAAAAAGSSSSAGKSHPLMYEGDAPSRAGPLVRPTNPCCRIQFELSVHRLSVRY
eukprot:121659-Rhodomonas_salina.2